MTRITSCSRVRAARRAVAAALLAVTLAPSPSAAQSADAIAETWAADAFTQADAGVEVAHVWSKGRRFREERVVSMVPIVTIVNGDVYYAIDGLAGRGVAISRSPKALADDAKGERPMDQQIQGVIKKGAEKVGTERIAGRNCVGYQITDQNGKQAVWVTDDALRLPVRAEIFDRQTGKSAKTHFTWARDLPIPDSFFEPDPRIQLERVGYDEYMRRVQAGEKVGPVPVIHGVLLHGE
jgi:hypothetical protein